MTRIDKLVTFRQSERTRYFRVKMGVSLSWLLVRGEVQTKLCETSVFATDCPFWFESLVYKNNSLIRIRNSQKNGEEPVFKATNLQRCQNGASVS